MQPENERTPEMSVAEHREAVKMGLKPGKFLKREVRVPGSKADYDSVMNVLLAAENKA